MDLQETQALAQALRHGMRSQELFEAANAYESFGWPVAVGTRRAAERLQKIEKINEQNSESAP